jgi:hypothetical protein
MVGLLVYCKTETKRRETPFHLAACSSPPGKQVGIHGDLRPSSSRNPASLPPPTPQALDPPSAPPLAVPAARHHSRATHRGPSFRPWALTSSRPRRGSAGARRRSSPTGAPQRSARARRGQRARRCWGSPATRTTTRRKQPGPRRMAAAWRRKMKRTRRT